MTDPYGKHFYYKTSTSVTGATAAGAIAKSEEERTAISTYEQQFRNCGVLSGNAQTGAAIAVRASCVQMADLFIEANVKHFADDPVDAKSTPSSDDAQGDPRQAPDPG